MTTDNDDEKYAKKDIKNLDADKRAEARGCVVIEPKPNELFIDIDRASDLECFWRNLGWLEDLVTGYIMSPSTSGQSDKYHIVVTLKRDVRDAYERIGLQAILGSDRLREVLSWRNAVHGSGRPTCFFEKKPETVTRVAVEEPETEVSKLGKVIHESMKSLEVAIIKLMEYKSDGR